MEEHLTPQTNYQWTCGLYCVSHDDCCGGLWWTCCTTLLKDQTTTALQGNASILPVRGASSLWIHIKSHINEDAVMESAPVESVVSPNIKWLHTYGGISSASLIHSTVSHWHAYLWQHISLCTKLPAPSSSLIANRLSLSLTNILATSKLQNAWIFEQRHFDSSNKSLRQTGTRLLIMVQSNPVKTGWCALAVVETWTVMDAALLLVWLIRIYEKA